METENEGPTFAGVILLLLIMLLIYWVVGGISAEPQPIYGDVEGWGCAPSGNIC